MILQAMECEIALNAWEKVKLLPNGGFNCDLLPWYNPQKASYTNQSRYTLKTNMEQKNWWFGVSVSMLVSLGISMGFLMA